MADTSTTGSIVIGLVNGMDNGILPSGTYNQVKPQMFYVAYNPNNYVTSITGSDICYSIGDGKFFISSGTNCIGGSNWIALASGTG
jgi:hypothetical protein